MEPGHKVDFRGYQFSRSSRDSVFAPCLTVQQIFPTSPLPLPLSVQIKNMCVRLTAMYYRGSGRFFLLFTVIFFVMVMNKVLLHCRVADNCVGKKSILYLQDSSLLTQRHRIIDWYLAIRQTAPCSHIFLRSKNS